MGQLDGKVAFITGAARGQGRSHAITLAAEGADIIALDICHQIDTVPYPMATPDDLEQTVKEVEALGRKIVAIQGDVRDMASVKSAVDEGVAALGRLDIVLANAGIIGWPLEAMETNDPSDVWRDGIDVMLTGVWNTLRVVAPVMTDLGNGGSIVITSSSVGLKGSLGANSAGGQAYTAAKHAVIGLMQTYASFLAKENIRVNTVHPTGVRTPMIINEQMNKFLTEYPDAEGADLTNLLDVDLVEPVDVSNAILWLVSDGARYVTGAKVPVDAGISIK